MCIKDRLGSHAKKRTGYFFEARLRWVKKVRLDRVGVD